MEQSHSMSYAAAGVDVTAGYEAVKRIGPLVKSTHIPGVMGSLGGFGGMFAPDVAGMEKPVLVSGTDGVGTKLKLAFLLDKHDTVGIDCVAMCVNDIICGGAMPLFFLDYIACGKNEPARIESIVSGIADGCRQAGCALIGGETAEMPGFYPVDEYDLAGFSVGMVDEKNIIDGSHLAEGDVIIGLASSGVHSNGFSLVRKVFELNKENVNTHYDCLGQTLGSALITPTRIYVSAIKSLLSKNIPIHAISHITGGGFYENVPRMMKDGLCAEIAVSSFPKLPIFTLIEQTGNIPTRDMYNTFNMGIGMMLALPKQYADDALSALTQSGEKAYLIGTVKKGDEGVTLV